MTIEDKCPECGGLMHPFVFDSVKASTQGHGVFYACENDCEHIELREFEITWNHG